MVVYWIHFIAPSRRASMPEMKGHIMKAQITGVITIKRRRTSWSRTNTCRILHKHKPYLILLTLSTTISDCPIVECCSVVFTSEWMCKCIPNFHREGEKKLEYLHYTPPPTPTGWLFGGRQSKHEWMNILLILRITYYHCPIPLLTIHPRFFCKHTPLRQHRWGLLHASCCLDYDGHYSCRDGAPADVCRLRCLLLPQEGSEGRSRLQAAHRQPVQVQLAIGHLPAHEQRRQWDGLGHTEKVPKLRQGVPNEWAAGGQTERGLPGEEVGPGWQRWRHHVQWR